jgi:hypothetical protein
MSWNNKKETETKCTVQQWRLDQVCLEKKFPKENIWAYEGGSIRRVKKIAK